VEKLGRVKSWLLPFTGFALILLIWQAAFSAQLLPNALFPSPLATIKELFHLGGTSAFWTDIFATLKLVLIAVVASALIGIPVGILSGSNMAIRQMTDAPVDFFRSIPAPAMFPMAIILFGINDVSKLAVTILACSLLIIVQVSGGVQNVNPIRRRVLELYAANAMQKARFQLLPEIAPYILTGVRLSISLALILIIVSEMLIGSMQGLGARMVHAQAAYLIEEMYSLIIFTGFLGYILNTFFQKIHIYDTGE
jgi:ABC-type nitrate/sulfonate/bicarbonate transport system permease component